MMNLRWAALALVSITIACGPSARHGDDDGACADGSKRCMGSTYQTCTAGQWQTAQDCPVACVDTLGCVACLPGATFCKDGNVWSCDATGNPGGQTQECTGNMVCDGGQCVDACANAEANKSYIGCEYWAVDLDNAVEVIDRQGSLNCSLTPGVQNATMMVCAMGNAVAGLCDPPGNTCPTGFTCQSTPVCILDAQHSPFAVVVSNPQAKPVDVTLTGANNATITKTIAAGQVQAIMPQQGGIPDQSIDGTEKGRRAYKLTSTLPIVAYQFNPLDNVNVFSNDASLLIPRTAFDTDYYAMSWPTLGRRTPAPGTHDYHGYITIVSWQNGTRVDVTPSAAVQASASQATIAPGTTVTFTLDAFETLNLEAAAPNADLTGTKIHATDGVSTFGVFGGHEAANFGELTGPDATHTNGPCCADHLEEMIFPTSTWGKVFAIARTKQRAGEPDLLRIMAQKPGTTVMFDPAPASGSCGTLDAGHFCDIKIQSDTTITASDPVLVGHYTESAIWADFLGMSVGNGDPSLAIAVPTEQYRTDYTLLIPNQYMENYLSISAQATGAVTVDGTAVTLAPFAGGYRSARVTVTAGQHTVHCPDGCGVLVYGYSDAVSYMFAGGLDLKHIVIN